MFLDKQMSAFYNLELYFREYFMTFVWRMNSGICYVIEMKIILNVSLEYSI
jgi:hypothetical protein